MTDGTAAAHRGARLAHHLLRGLVIAMGLVTALMLWHQVRADHEAVTTWQRHDARVESLADERWLELEVHERVLQSHPALRQPPHAAPNEPHHARVLVPRPLHDWLLLRQQVTLALDPAAGPSAEAGARVLDPMSLAVPLVAKALLLALLAWAWRALRHLPWGRDETWLDDRGWTATAEQAARVGWAAQAEDVLNEPAEHRRGTRFWAGFFALATVAALIGVMAGWDEAPIGSVALLLGVTALDLLLAHQFITIRTRAVRFDGQGVADGSWFQTRRVPWAAIATFQRVNTNAEAQCRHDERWRTGRSGTGTRRPSDQWRWIARAASGAELLRLPAEAERHSAFARLRQRVQGRLGFGPTDQRFEGEGAHATDEDDETGEDMAEGSLDAAAQAEQQAQRAAWERDWRQSQARHRRLFDRIGLVLGALFLVPALWATCNGVYYAFFAERAEGTVIDKPAGRLPSLQVAFTPRGTAAAGEPVTVKSGGAAAYGRIALGQKITVLYSPEAPARARLDLFWEVWLWAVAGWFFALVAIGPMWFIRTMIVRQERPSV
ncbi:MAG: hypothetical protein JNJ89_01075 [Rubrivivax sp.]|nr:hypothetical protein [Rubrivivax sp.]